MCLDRLATEEELKKFPFNGVKREGNHQVGYKEFDEHAKGLTFLYIYMEYSKFLPKGKWLNERDYRSYERWTNLLPTDCSSSVTYPKGFHLYPCYSHYKSAQDKRTKVYYRKIVARGYQDEYAVIVVEEIFIPKTEGGDKT